MKVLQICLKPPVPEMDGGCKAMNNITLGLLSNNVDVKVITISTPKHPFKKKEISNKYIAQTAIEDTYIDTSVNAISAFLNLFSSRSYNVERFYSKAFEKLITTTIQKDHFDVILLESLYVTGYVKTIREHTNAKIVYRAHNVESEIWYRNAEQEKGLKKSYFQLLAKRIKKYEQQLLNRVDAIAAITEKDKKEFLQLGCKMPMEVFPFGIDSKNYVIESNISKHTVCHIGSMDWKPNQFGINWFLTNVWNDVIEKFPEAKLNLAGKNMPRELLEHKQKNVNIVGEVADANQFINQNEIMVVPLFSGSGMRIKIIEGMALQKLVIATQIAAEGISYTDKQNIVIANTKEEFTDSILLYLNNIEQQKQIAENARELIRTHYDNQLIVNNLVRFFNQIKHT